MYKRIILAYDGSTSGQLALLKMKELEYWESPSLTLVAVVPTYSLDVGAVEMGYIGHANADSNSEEESFRKQLDQGVKSLRSMGLEAQGELLKGEVIREISKFAEAQKADLIVVGHKHERSLLRRWWTGSTAKSLVEEAPCSVLIVVHQSD